MRDDIRSAGRRRALALLMLVAACGSPKGSERTASSARPGEEVGAGGSTTPSSDNGTGTSDTNADSNALTGISLIADLDDTSSDTADSAVVQLKLVKASAVIPMTGISATCEVLSSTGTQLNTCSFSASAANATTTATVKKTDLSTAKLHSIVTYTATKKTLDLSFPLLPLSGTPLQALTELKIWAFGAQPINRTLSSSSYCDTTGTPLASITATVGGVLKPVADWTPDKTVGFPDEGYCFLPLADYVGDHGTAELASPDVVATRYAAGPSGGGKAGGCSIAIIGKGAAGTGDRLIVQQILNDSDGYNFRATTFRYRCGK